MLPVVLDEFAGSLLEPVDELPVPPAVPLPEVPLLADDGLEEEPMPELALPLLLVVEPGVVLELDGLEDVPDVPARSPLQPATTSSVAAIIA